MDCCELRVRHWNDWLERIDIGSERLPDSRLQGMHDARASQTLTCSGKSSRECVRVLHACGRFGMSKKSIMAATRRLAFDLGREDVNWKAILIAVVVSALTPACATPSAAERNSLRTGGIYCLDFQGVSLVTDDMNDKQLESVRCARAKFPIYFRIIDTSTRPPAFKIAVDLKTEVRVFWTRPQDINL